MVLIHSCPYFRICSRVLSAIEVFFLSSLFWEGYHAASWTHFLRHYLQAEGSLYQMVAELDLPRPVLVPQGYLLRGLKPNEEEKLIEVVNTAGQGLG
jgi:hypothetical protein